jgi:beta-lactamase regulating signal transducer with metallopeptidase domain
MTWLILLAAKSFLIAGAALLLLKLMQKRSAADRSWIAHLALAALLILPFAAFAPTLDVVGPKALVGKAEVQSTSALPSAFGEPAHANVAAKPARAAVVSQSEEKGAPFDWPFWGYLTPAAVLLLLTLISLARLVILKARATVLVDAPWLTALARAQKRMGFKHGTALLTSNELPSPISWGVVRPVILLNSEAAESHEEAEAIITHELAHVARLDWAKLLLARVAVALFWFNPLVWLLSREAHQLREEAADDAVLATDIDGAEYASLLVGVARHECRGILIGAHGVAPGRNSLTRRVKRVLDSAVRRAPGGWRWGSAAAFFAAGMIVPVAALNLVPAASAAEGNYPAITSSSPNTSGVLRAASSNVAATLAVSSSNNVNTIAPGLNLATDQQGATELRSTNGSAIVTSHGQTVLRSSDGSTITVAAPDANGRRRTVLQGANGSVVAFADASAVPGLAVALASSPEAGGSNSAVDRAIAMKTLGVTPDYAASIRAAAPQLRFSNDDMVALKGAGVSAAFIQELARLGYRNVTAEDITGAYAMGVREDYVHALASAGYGLLPLRELIQLKAVGVTPADLQRFRQAGFDHLDPDKLIQLKTLGITPEELKASERNGP